MAVRRQLWQEKHTSSGITGNGTVRAMITDAAGLYTTAKQAYVYAILKKMTNALKAYRPA